MATVPTRTLHELADGVWVWLQPGGESGVSNAGVVADDDGLTVIDTLMVRSQWEPFANAVATPRPARCAACCSRTRTSTTSAAPARSRWRRCSVRRRRASCSTARCPSPRTSRSCPRSKAEFDELAELGTRPVTHLVTDAAELTPAHRSAARDRSHRRRRDGARRRRRRAVRGRPLLLRGHAARVPGRLRDVGRRARRGRGARGRRSCPATVRSAARPKSASCSSTCVTASRARSRRARGTSWPERDPRDTINIERAQLLARGSRRDPARDAPRARRVTPRVTLDA